MANNYTVALAGNPNVGKSTIFNSLTGMHQHTGNWTGKTVANATGEATIKDRNFLFVDIPGTYSIMSNSEEEEIARDYICFGNPDVTLIVVDSTCLERNLNFVFQIMEITKNIIVCVNLLDEAKKKKIKIDLKKLEEILGVPVVGTTARDKKTLENLKDVIYKLCIKKIKSNPKYIKYNEIIESNISILEQKVKEIYNVPKSRWISIKLIDGEKKILDSIQEHLKINFENEELKESLKEVRKTLKEKGVTQNNFKDKIVSEIVEKAESVSQKVCTYENINYSSRDRKVDKILTSKKFGIPIMILFLGLIFWITIVGANYPTEALFCVFNWFKIC